MTAALALLLPVMASAHEHRDLDNGHFSVIVGWSTEPAYTGFLNGLDLRVYDDTQPATPSAEGGDDAPSGAPVEGLEGTLKAQIIYGDQTADLTLEPRWNTPGAYDAWIVPVAAGDYSFRIYGTIGDTPVDETFTSGPDTFGTVVDQATIQFPKASASTNTGAPVIGAVNSGGGIDMGAIGGGIAGIAAGAAGMLLIQRRRNHAPQLAPSRAGIGASANLRRGQCTTSFSRCVTTPRGCDASRR